MEATKEEKCRLCDNLFLVGEKYDDFGSTFEDGKKDHYFVHVGCHKKAMDEYRQRQIMKHTNQ